MGHKLLWGLFAKCVSTLTVVTTPAALGFFALSSLPFTVLEDVPLSLEVSLGNLLSALLQYDSLQDYKSHTHTHKNNKNNNNNNDRGGFTLMGELAS